MKLPRTKFSSFIPQVLCFLAGGFTDPSPNLHYPNVKDELFEQPINLMAPKKSPHLKNDPDERQEGESEPPFAPYDFSKFDDYLTNIRDSSDPSSPEHNRIKRRAKRRRSRISRRRDKVSTSDENDKVKPGANASDTRRSKSSKKKKDKINYDTYEPPGKEFEANFVEMPKDLYQAHLRPGVIFRIHMSEAILKMQYRNYGEDKDESVIEADVEYLRLTRKVINDEITKFEDLKWLMSWFSNRSDLVTEHACNTRYFSVGTPPTMFTHTEEYMKRLCLFDNVYIDHIPYVIGEDSSLMAAVAPPVLHCDAATCTSVPFIDSLMFDETLPRTNVRTVTRCQASCRAHCKNDADCLKRCSDRCLRAD